MADILTITSDVLPDDIHVVSIKGREGLSEIYQFEIGLISSDSAFEIEDAVRGRAKLDINLGDDNPPYFFHGIFASIELLHEWAGKALYRAVLVPQFWQLLLTKHSRVFTDESIPDIITAILEASDLTSSDFSLKLQESYDPKDFVAQYKESNFHFIQRWMEREGMYFYFEQGDDAEKLIITDSKGFHADQEGEALRYVPASGDDTMALQSFDIFRCKSQALPASVELLDYDYLKPSLALMGTADVVTEGFGQISVWDENFATNSDGKRLAKIRSEELLARQKVFYGTGRVFYTRPGYLFALEEHPRESFNAQYLTTHIEHVGNQSASDPKVMKLLDIDYADEYRADVTAISSEVQFRAPDRVPWPRVEGYESAIVCGGSDTEYAQIDDHGRYKVRILFDESDLDDGIASAWVRMQQPYGGGNEGWHFPLTKGTEVLLFFSGGDPDQPVIAGVAPNAQKPSPVIKQNHTTNIIQTLNFNLIEIEDNRGNQYIYQYCPIKNSYIRFGVDLGGFNFILNTEGHAHFNFEGDQVIDVNLTLTENVGLDVTYNYNSSWLVNVIIDNTIEIGGNLSIHVVGEVSYNFDNIWFAIVLGNVNFEFQSDYSLYVAGLMQVLVDGDVLLDYESNYSLDVAATALVHVEGDVTHNFDSNVNITIGGDVIENITGSYTHTDGNDVDWITRGNKKSGHIGTTFSLFVGNKAALTIANSDTITIGNSLSVSIGNMISAKLANALNVTISNELNMSVANKINISAACQVNMTAGCTVNVEGAPEATTAPTLLKAIGAAVWL